MNIDAGLIRILVVFIPGIIGRSIFKQLKASKQQNIWEELLEIFAIAFISYALAALLICTYENKKIDYQIKRTTAIYKKAPSVMVQSKITTLKNKKHYPIPRNIEAVVNESKVDWLELALSSILAVFVSIIIAVFYNKKLLNRFGRWIGITRSYGDGDVWEYFQNSPDVDWIIVRDFRHGLSYYGHVQSFSDSFKPRELLLTEVKIYSLSQGNEIDYQPAVYLSLLDNDVTIEIPQIIGDFPSVINQEKMDQIKSLANKDQMSIIEKAYKYNMNIKRYAFRKINRNMTIKLQRVFNELDIMT